MTMTPSSGNLPRHVAIIMDGNGRWAKKRGLMRLMGHKVGVDSVKKVVETARIMGIEVLTLYAFSTENWHRPAAEVSGLMELLRTFLRREVDNMMANNIRLRAIGQTTKLPDSARQVLEEVMEKTAGNTGLVLNLALSYGSRDEIVRAARRFAAECSTGKRRPEELDEELFSSYLDTAGLPDPDFVIRTSGEFRLSNFLLWQLSYAELYITDIPWPEFREAEFREAIAVFQRRQRRFGRTGDQVAEG